MKIELESFSSLRSVQTSHITVASTFRTSVYPAYRYIGVQTTRLPTSYDNFRHAIQQEIINTAVRSPRQPGVIYQAIDLLNIKFSGKIKENSINPFPEQYFTCGVHCESCDERCDQSMGHIVNGLPHTNSKLCRYQHQYENKVFMCQACHTNGREVSLSFRCSPRIYVCFIIDDEISTFYIFHCKNELRPFQTANLSITTMLFSEIFMCHSLLSYSVSYFI